MQNGAKWLRKEIGKKMSLSILVNIKNFHDRIFAILIGIGIAITIFFWYRDRDLDQDFLSSSVSLSRSRKTVIDDKPVGNYRTSTDTYFETSSSVGREL